MIATVTLATTDQAQALAAMPQLAAGRRPDVSGTTVTIDADALNVLAELPDDNDGHYDGRYIWISGAEYPVIQERPEIPVVSLREAAVLLGYGDTDAGRRAAESRLRNAGGNGIRSGYPRAAVEWLAAQPKRPGARTDLKEKLTP